MAPTLSLGGFAAWRLTPLLRILPVAKYRGRASVACESPSGRRNSSTRISPGWTVRDRRAIAVDRAKAAANRPTLSVIRQSAAVIRQALAVLRPTAAMA
jgi:hypothetical protein